MSYIKEEIFEFIKKIINLLNNKGRMIGDIPNKDKLNRFLNSERENFSKDRGNKTKSWRQIHKSCRLYFKRY